MPRSYDKASESFFFFSKHIEQGSIYEQDWRRTEEEENVVFFKKLPVSIMCTCVCLPACM